MSLVSAAMRVIVWERTSDITEEGVVSGDVMWQERARKNTNSDHLLYMVGANIFCGGYLLLHLLRRGGA